MPVPLSCCVDGKDCNTGDEKNIYMQVRRGGGFVVCFPLSFQGCYEKVIDFLNANIGIVAGAAVGIAFFPLLGAVLSCCLANTINKAKYEQMA